MSSAYPEDLSPTPWRAELDRLCDGESGWSLLQCIAPMMLARLAAQAASENPLSESVRVRLETEHDLSTLVDSLLTAVDATSLSEEDSLFLKNLAQELPGAIRQWSEQHAPLYLEHADDAAIDSAEEADNALVKAACALLQFVESLPLHDSACFDEIVGACVAASGKTAGLFSSPECVSTLIARLIETELRDASSLYDPCAGVGHMLSACIAAHGDKELAVFGQDVDSEAYSLLRMRSIAASIDPKQEGNPKTISAKLGDVLAGPWHSEEAPFDVVVSHAPTLLTWPGKSNEAIAADERFACAGALAPKDAADLAFVMHAYHCLAEGGIATLVVYPAPLRRGDAERTIRRHLLEVDAIDAVIQLPPKLFADSSMAANILVLRKGRENEDVLFIDTMDRCERIDGENTLTREAIDQIASAFITREEVEGFARNVSKGEIVRKAWSLTVADYFQDKAPKITVDLDVLKRKMMTEVSDPAVFSKRIVNGLIR